MAERVVSDLLDEALTIGDGDPALLHQTVPDVREHDLVQRVGVEGRVVQTRAEVSDD